MTTAKNDNAHDSHVGIEEAINDLQVAPPQMVASFLKEYQDLTEVYSYLKPLLDINYDIIPNTAGTVAVELKHLMTNKTVSLACFYPDEPNKKPYITEVSKLCSLVMGTNNPDGDCYVIDGSLSDAIRLFSQLNIIDEKDDTIHLVFNKFDTFVSKLAETMNVKIITTADKKHDLAKRLKGANVNIYSTINSVFLDLEQGYSLDDALKDAEVINLLELSIEHEGGFIESFENGLHLVKYDEDGEIKHDTHICPPLEVLARSRDINSTSWGLLIQWKDHDNKLHRWAMPAHTLQGDSGEYRKQLANQGFDVYAGYKALNAFLIKHPTPYRATCVNQTGWHDDAYVLPDTTLNNSKDLIVYQSDKPSDVIYSQQGTLEQWKNKVCKPLADQSRIAFAISCAFAGQLLHLIGADSGGFHIVGGSSMGKSIGLKVAGSVWGNPDKFIKRWRVTDNGLESVASTHNDSFLGLDEISEGDPKSVGNSAYMLANGQGKVRAKAGGGNRPTSTWRLIFLSNGEKTLDTYLRTAGIEANAGQMVRLIHIEADAGKGYRSFDSLVIADTAEEQANLIKQLSTTYYGTAGMAWLEYLLKDKDTATKRAKQLVADFLNDYKEVKGQAYRVAERFAIVATAGEMATEANITGWKAGQATSAVKVCFDNWLDNYGSDGSLEERQIIKQVQSFIEKHGSSRFQLLNLSGYQDNEPKVINRIGWRKPDENLYLFYTNSFSEVCGTFEVKKVIQVLNDAGLIQKNEKDRDTYKIKLPDAVKRQRLYAITGEILNYDGTTGTDGTPHINQGLERVPNTNTVMGQMGQTSNLSQESQSQKNNGTHASPVNSGLSQVSHVSQAKNTIGDLDKVPEGFV